MNNIIKKIGAFAATGVLIVGCNKFEEINKNPLAASTEQVQVEYFLNNSIIGAQMDPHIAERVFVLYWGRAGRQILGTGIAGGTSNDGWSSDYYSYLNGWLNGVNSAIQVGKEKIAQGSSTAYTNNLVNVSRIWRAYLMSEMADNFGPIAIDGFQGVNPKFASVKDVYYFMLDELKDATNKIDVAVANPSGLSKQDPAYGFNYAKWKRYGNSMRMRLAMRIAEVDAAKAKTEFEDAASKDLITSLDHTFQVQEKPGWDPLTGVMSREWNPQFLSASMKNAYVGIGGITSASQLPAALQPAIKADKYIGVKYDSFFPVRTNDKLSSFWLDGLPNKIDPRAYKTYIIPGYFDNPEFNKYPSWSNDATNTKAYFTNKAGDKKLDSVEAKYTYNGFAVGAWGDKGSKNGARAYEGTMPRMANKYRNSQNKRVFFAAWETYFLLAEAAVKGWTVPMSAKAAYEAGVKASFEYHGVSSFADAYLASNDYNNNGTSANWDHIAEPPTAYTATYVDGNTKVAGTISINYPNNTIYKNGTVKNDLLTKIITQKFIAQTPWLPLEAWSDHRRLGLPFFENPALEEGASLPGLPALTSSNYMTNQVAFFPQRLKYPSGLKNGNPEGYQQAVSLLGGTDAELTPLWWAKKQ